MSFLHPALLWALPTMALPIGAHLLSQRSLQVVPFAPIAWLRGSDVRSMGKHRLHRWLLLLVRMAVLGAAVLLCAHPVAPLDAAGQVSEQAVRHGVLVVDASASMNYRTAAGTLMATAKQLAHAQVARSPAGSTWALVVVGGQGPQVQPFMDDLQTAQEAIARGVPSQGAGRADLAQGIEQAQSLIHGAQVEGSIVVIGDLSRSSLPHGVPQPHQTAPGPLPPITWLDAAQRAVGPAGDLAPLPNVAVTGLQVRPGAGVVVSLRNYGAAAVTERGLTVSLDGAGGETLRGFTSLPPGGAVEKLFALGTGRTGVATATARLDAVALQHDGYPADDVLQCALTFAPPLRVLAIDGAPHSRARASELFYTERALLEAPRERGALAVTVVPRSELTRALAPRGTGTQHDVLLLANVGQVTAAEAQLLTHQRQQGVGLVVGLGDALALGPGDADAQAYRGFVPFELRDVAVRGTRPAAFSALQVGHPVLRDMGDAALAALRRVRTNQYVFVAPETGHGSQVLMAYDDGAPALIEAPGQAGLGAVLLWTSSLDADWTTLPLMGVYVPLLQRLVVHAAQRTTAPQAPPDEAQQLEHMLLESDFTPLAAGMMAETSSAAPPSGSAAVPATQARHTPWPEMLAAAVWLLLAAEMASVARALAGTRRQGHRASRGAF